MSFLGGVSSSVEHAVTDPGELVKEVVNDVLPKNLAVVGDAAGARRRRRNRARDAGAAGTGSTRSARSAAGPGRPPGAHRPAVRRARSSLGRLACSSLRPPTAGLERRRPATAASAPGGQGGRPSAVARLGGSSPSAAALGSRHGGACSRLRTRRLARHHALSCDGRLRRAPARARQPTSRPTPIRGARLRLAARRSGRGTTRIEAQRRIQLGGPSSRCSAMHADREMVIDPEHAESRTTAMISRRLNRSAR